MPAFYDDDFTDEFDPDYADDDHDDSDDLIDCPECGRAIYDDSEQCPLCGHYLIDDRTSRSFRSASSRNWFHIIVYVLIGALVLPFLLVVLQFL